MFNHLRPITNDDMLVSARLGVRRVVRSRRVAFAIGRHIHISGRIWRSPERVEMFTIERRKSLLNLSYDAF